MHVKKGDNVVILAGKDKGKSGAILRAFPREDKVLVEGINLKKVHERSRQKEGRGQMVEKSFPVHVSNVKLSSDKPKEKTKTKASAKKVVKK
ncbi:MAG: 50S ribosomal protein L24 [Parcubacteria group bacterium]